MIDFTFTADLSDLTDESMLEMSDWLDTHAPVF